MNRNDKVSITYGLLVDTADAIRAQKGTSSLINPLNFPSTIASIDGRLPIELKMTFKNNTPANAHGEIVLSAINAEYTGEYDIFWGDANGVMSNYSKITTLDVDVAHGKTMDSIKLMEFNAIPKYATRLCAVKNGSIVCSFDIPSFKLWASGNYGEHLYSVGVLSDVHIQYITGGDDVRVAMTYLNQRENVVATCISGDLTRNGTESELDTWKASRDEWSPDTPVYSSVGNHEAKATSSLVYVNLAAVRKYLDSDWVDETESSFIKIINNDVYMFLGIFDNDTASSSHTMFSNEQLEWIEAKLEQYRNQRVFLFMHVPPKWTADGISTGGLITGFGNGNGAYSYDVWGDGRSDRVKFLNLIDHYKNVIWFSGHSHIKYEYQKLWEYLNVLQFKGGARFVHVSSLTVPRDIVDGAIGDQIYAESEGAVMDVYPNAIRVRCRNFVGEKFYGLCEYIIDTTPVTIPPNTKTLIGITATKSKVNYYTDETFSTSDISVIATFSDNSTLNVTDDAVIDTSNVHIDTEGTYTIGIRYVYGEVTATASIQVTFAERPSSVELASISATKTKTSYVIDESFSASDISVIALFSDDSTLDVSSVAEIDTSGVDTSTEGSYTIPITYTNNGITKTTSIIITVSASTGYNWTIIDNTKIDYTTGELTENDEYMLTTRFPVEAGKTYQLDVAPECNYGSYPRIRIVVFDSADAVVPLAYSNELWKGEVENGGMYTIPEGATHAVLRMGKKYLQQSNIDAMNPQTVTLTKSPTLILDVSISGAITAQGEDAPNYAINNDYGSHKSGSGHHWAYSNDANARGKTLYYRMIGDISTDVDTKIGAEIGSSTAYYRVDGQKLSYLPKVTDWTVLRDENGDEIKLSAATPYITLRYRSGAESTAAFPVNVNTEIQISYINT